jgi:hypothetical protein
MCWYGILDLGWWEQPRFVRRLNILEEGIAIDYALKSSSNIGDDFGGVSYGAGPGTGGHRQQFDRSGDSGSTNDYTGDATGGYRQ